jgi:hypothetical protein
MVISWDLTMKKIDFMGFNHENGGFMGFNHEKWWFQGI